DRAFFWAGLITAFIENEAVFDASAAEFQAAFRNVEVMVDLMIRTFEVCAFGKEKVSLFSCVGGAGLDFYEVFLHAVKVITFNNYP
ncbi:MAG: hypothetical protein ACJAX1_003121, partial [Neolewinella sp.]